MGISRRIVHWTACGLLLLSCGGGTAEKGASGSSGPPGPRKPVELTVRTPDGRMLFVGDLQGSPTLLFLFATFDGVSQAALRSVKRFARRHPDVQVLGIAVQPNPQALLDAWAYALEPNFPVGYEPEDRIAEGTSALGEIEAVPTFVMLDSTGFEAQRHTGFVSDEALEWMLWETRRRGAADAGAPPPGGQPPLLGQVDGGVPAP